MKRYSLISSFYGKELVVKLNDYDKKTGNVVKKDKVDLATIDLFTTSFGSQLEYNRTYGLPDNAKLYIIYQSRGQTKKIPCIFGDNALIRHMASIVSSQPNKNEINENNHYFKELMRNFIAEICFTSYRNYVMSDLRINLYIKNKIQEFMGSNANNKFYADKIIKELQNYKNLRSVILNLQEYEIKREKSIINIYVPLVKEEVVIPDVLELSRFIPSEEMEEPLFPPNSEEERQYENYLVSIPDEDYSLEKGYQLRKTIK